MKIAFLIIKIILILLLIFNLFFWAGLYAAGHNIPKKTDVTFAIRVVSLILALIVLAFIKRRFVK